MDVRTTRRTTAQEKIRLDPEGNWFHGEYPILHDRTVQFLYKNIALDADGQYYLTGEDKPVFIEVQDVPYWITKVERTIAGYLITLTDGCIELLNTNVLWLGKENALYSLVKDGEFAAKFFRGPYHEIMKDLHKSGDRYYLVLGKQKFAVQTTPPKIISQRMKKASGALKKKRKKNHKKTPKKKARKTLKAKQSSPKIQRAKKKGK